MNVEMMFFLSGWSLCATSSMNVESLPLATSNTLLTYGLTCVLSLTVGNRFKYTWRRGSRIAIYIWSVLYIGGYVVKGP